MLARLHQNESVDLRPGDVVFCYKPGRLFPLHVGISTNPKIRISNGNQILVTGLPQGPWTDGVNEACWGTPDNYHADIIGQRLDVDEIRLKEVCLIAEAVRVEHSSLGTMCSWNRERQLDLKRTIRDGIPLFIKGTCSHFVEYLYDSAKLDLIREDITRDPDDPDRLYPATQVHAFWAGAYPLSCPWDKRLRSYPDCLFGAQSTTL